MNVRMAVLAKVFSVMALTSKLADTIRGRAGLSRCLAMGDDAAEDLFVLAAEAGIDNISIIRSPVDFRVRALPKDMPPAPAWTQELYTSIRQELNKLVTMRP